MRAYKVGLAMLLSVFCLQRQAQADGSSESAQRGYVGVLLGAGAVNNGGGTNLTYGLGGGYRLSPRWGVGLDVSYNTFTAPSPLSANLTLVLANAKYDLGSGFFGGLKAGTGSVSYSGTGAPGSATGFAW